jgi:hypothetical protein
MNTALCLDCGLGDKDCTCNEVKTLREFWIRQDRGDDTYFKVHLTERDAYDTLRSFEMITHVREVTPLQDQEDTYYMRECDRLKDRLSKVDGLLERLVKSEALKEAQYYGYSEAVSDANEYLENRDKLENKT